MFVEGISWKNICVWPLPYVRNNVLVNCSYNHCRFHVKNCCIRIKNRTCSLQLCY